MREAEWAYIETAQIYNNRRTRLPPQIGKHVIIDDRYMGEVVNWNHDTEADVMLVSKFELEAERYDSAGNSKVHDHQNTVTPPKGLIDDIFEDIARYDVGEVFGRGKKMVYLATDEMVSEEPHSYYLVSSPRFFELLDENSEKDDSRAQLLKSAMLP
jgi:hypothetical protein